MLCNGEAALHAGCQARGNLAVNFAALSSKGRITLPAAVRRAMGLVAGSRVAIETRGDEIVVRRARDFLALRGFLGRAAERAAMARAASRKERA